MSDKPMYQCGTPERRVVYAWEGEVERLRAALIQVRGFASVMDEHNWRDMRAHISRQCLALEK